MVDLQRPQHEGCKYRFQEVVGKMFPSELTGWHPPVPTMTAFSLNGEEIRLRALLWFLLVLLFPSPPVITAATYSSIMRMDQHLPGCSTQTASTTRNGSVCFNMQIPLGCIQTYWLQTWKQEARNNLYFNNSLWWFFGTVKFESHQCSLIITIQLYFECPNFSYRREKMSYKISRKH